MRREFLIQFSFAVSFSDFVFAVPTSNPDDFGKLEYSIFNFCIAIKMK